ncbi:acyl-CoA-binding domain-containing protein 5A [Synchiropus picturatus]
MEVDSLSAEDELRLIQRRFDAAVRVIKSLPPDGPFQPSNDMMLKFYSYYKQATLGSCNIPRPGFWDAVGKAKWDAWNSLGDMPKEEAMAAYVDEMKLILEGMPMTDEVEELLRVLCPFYELVDEKKKITQISDLSAARLTQFARQLEGFGTMLNTAQSKSVARSVVRTMEMNGTLQTRAAKAQEVREESDEDSLAEDEDDEAVEEKEEAVLKENQKDYKSAAPQPKRAGASRRPRGPVSNGKLANGGDHLTNGGHSKVAVNGDHHHDECEPLLNGHHADLKIETSGHTHPTSDSDSEVYCDSVDQFGQEENLELNRSREDLDEEEEEGRLQPLDPEEKLQVVRCGGEDGDNGGLTSPRQRLNMEGAGGSSGRGGRGSRSGRDQGSGSLVLVHSGGDGHGGRRGGAGSSGRSLNEQIVVALNRLQEDMQSVLERLHTLEALTATQARSVALSPVYPPSRGAKKSRTPSWWPFDISPTSLAFAVIWPFVVQWLIRLYLQRRRRRIH